MGFASAEVIVFSRSRIMKVKTLLISAICFLGVNLGCQEGVKKTEETKIHSEGVAQLKSIRRDLQKYDVDLGADVSTEEKLQALQLSEFALRTENKLQVQLLLEDYIFKGSKLLALGDTRVVVFAESVKINETVQVASHYLGLLYADLPLESKKTVIQTKEVGYAELSARGRKIYKEMKLFEKAGITTDVMFDEARLIKMVRSLSSQQVSILENSSGRIAKHAARIDELLQIHNNFGKDIFKNLGKNYLSIAQAYGHVLYLMVNERKAR